LNSSRARQFVGYRSCFYQHPNTILRQITVPEDQFDFDTSFDVRELSDEDIILFMSMKLYVGNLSFNTSNFDLEELFGGVGTVESANVVEDRETGRSRGFGFVEMSSK